MQANSSVADLMPGPVLDAVDTNLHTRKCKRAALLIGRAWGCAGSGRSALGRNRPSTVRSLTGQKADANATIPGAKSVMKHPLRVLLDFPCPGYLTPSPLAHSINSGQNRPARRMRLRALQRDEENMTRAPVIAHSRVIPTRTCYFACVQDK
jgi:hypothetical protein